MKLASGFECSGSVKWRWVFVRELRETRGTHAELVGSVAGFGIDRDGK